MDLDAKVNAMLPFNDNSGVGAGFVYRRRTETMAFNVYGIPTAYTQPSWIMPIGKVRLRPLAWKASRMTPMNNRFFPNMSGSTRRASGKAYLPT